MRLLEHADESENEGAAVDGAERGALAAVEHVWGGGSADAAAEPGVAAGATRGGTWGRRGAGGGAGGVGAGLVLVPLEAHDTLTTPSAMCFVPAMGTAWSRAADVPSAPRRPRPVSSIELSGTAGAAAVERVVAHVKRVARELAGTGIPLIGASIVLGSVRSRVAAYTPSGAPLPPQIASAVEATGCRAILAPPFSPEAVGAALAMARPATPRPTLSLAALPRAPSSPPLPSSPLPPLAPLVPPPHLAARASYSCPHMYAPALPPCVRRRSVDVGGLALALSGVGGHGGGWGGWAGAEDELALAVKGQAKSDAMYAELLSQMYTQTGAAVDRATDPPDPFAYHPGSGRDRLIALLDRWEFEPHKLPDEDLLACATLLFEAALNIDGMQDDVGVAIAQIPPFLRAVRNIYRTQNQYHNFQHALDVFQAVYWFLCRAGVVPPVKILSANRDPPTQFVNGFQHLAPGKWRRSNTSGRIAVLRNVDIFALLLAAVGHDVGHPGLSNAFMVRPPDPLPISDPFQTNADTPLSRVFDHKSSLEQLHCALLLRLMHKYGMGHLLNSRPASSPPSPASFHQRADPRGFRWLLVQTVLATDMSVHFDWIKRFNAYAHDCQNGPFKGTEDDERLMICQALIKCGDISNPVRPSFSPFPTDMLQTRPHAVSEHWSRVLLEEWACQATFEQELDLPVTVVNVDVENGAKQQAQGQVNFIDIFTQPLFDATAQAIPLLHPITEQCALNRKLWQARMEALGQAPNAPARARTPSQGASTQEAHYRSIFPLSLPPALSQNPTSQTQPTRPSSSGSTSTLGGSLFSPTGSTSSVTSVGANGKYAAVGIAGSEPSAVRVAYKASIRKKKSFHRVSWPAQQLALPTMPMPMPMMPSPLADR
ncbi:hypothetical protein CTheo_4166 [Ceratobasidium theobromae]|uniref:Phosphodiesterase n=1 Tax=Ceratobasidium theobromae TaxID=1582974 RepID=A0A5N5QKX6_9AGAM|nr:hypothetical protein CTheo_4166 [Ceratobasidium theobromae]